MYHRLKHSNWWRYVVTLIIGGVLVAFGYLIGNSTTDVNAQNEITEFDIVKCKTLIVSDGNPEHGIIMLAISETGPELMLIENGDLNKTKILIKLSINTKVPSAELHLTHEVNDGSHIGFVAGNNASAVMTITSQKRLTDAFNLFVGPNGSQINLENEVVNFKLRKR